MEKQLPLNNSPQIKGQDIKFFLIHDKWGRFFFFNHVVPLISGMKAFLFSKSQQFPLEVLTCNCHIYVWILDSCAPQLLHKNWNRQRSSHVFVDRKMEQNGRVRSQRSIICCQKILMFGSRIQKQTNYSLLVICKSLIQPKLRQALAEPEVPPV